MPDNQLEFHSAYGKRRILIVEDELINQEMLKIVLDDVYDIISAETGAEALARLAEGSETISLVLLDLNLPDMHGLEVLKQMKADSRSARIPVIVMTAEKDAEVESLTLGASDCISKPYPKPEVVRARVLRTIELFEGRDIIRSTERDALTGLYNREFFYRYVAQLDTFHRDMPMDAVVLDVNHFHITNERYGRDFGDAVLRRIGEALRRLSMDTGSIVCRLEGDAFLIYCPHREEYGPLLDLVSAGLDSRVRLRMGVYPEVDKTIDVERRFDRAKTAADTLRSSVTRSIAIFDKVLHESEIFSEQLLEEFPQALEEKQFRVFYQPKFDIRPDEPVLCSAEALVRWQHPRLGMVSPGTFIPLFESNGLIQQLDRYVWREAAAQMRDWKARLGISVPVSVNVSRVDMFDPDLVDDIRRLTDEFGLSPSELLLEITESAYTQDSTQIIEKVSRLRACGFRVEMDDFGSGYSSLNMISTLPMDALKLDMQFIQNAFKNRRNVRMLEVVIDIANSLTVPTIAEGVETAEQLFALKGMGCDIVQGYYFSKPVPAEEYEAFLLERRRADVTPSGKPEKTSRVRRGRQFTYDAMHDPCTGLYNQSGYEMLLNDADQAHIALILAHVDGFEALRTERGAAVADRVAVRVAGALRNSFRSVDLLCRISDDAFVVIMTRADSGIRNLIVNKVAQINAALGEPEGDLPPVTLSVGVAFSDRENPGEDILLDAEAAMNRVKGNERGGCEIY